MLGQMDKGINNVMLARFLDHCSEQDLALYLQIRSVQGQILKKPKFQVYE